MTISSNIYTLPSALPRKSVFAAPGNLTLGLGAGNLTIHTNETNEFVKKYEMIEIIEDLLALSCTWYRIRQHKNVGNSIFTNISTLLSPDLFRCVTQEDRDYANKIRDYYSKKIMVWTLKEQRLTPYRQDLNAFLHGEATKFIEKMLPLAYRLPEFYEYDSEFDKIKGEFSSQIGDFRKGISKSNVAVTLTPVTKFNRNVRKVKTKEYWLKDSNNLAYRFNLEPTNPIINLWEREFNRPEINLTVNVTSDERDDFRYYQLRGMLDI